MPPLSRWRTSTVSTNFSSCRTICPTAVSSAPTTRVNREKPGRSVCPTLRLLTLYPRRETSPANRYLPRRNMAAPAQGTPE